MKTRMFVIHQGEYIYPTLYETKEDASLKIKNIESFDIETGLCLDVFLEVTGSYAIEGNKPRSIMNPSISSCWSAFKIAYRPSVYITQVVVTMSVTKPLELRKEAIIARNA